MKQTKKKERTRLRSRFSVEVTGKTGTDGLTTITKITLRPTRNGGNKPNEINTIVKIVDKKGGVRHGSRPLPSQKRG